MSPSSNADRDLAEQGKQSTKTKERNARLKQKNEEHPAVPPGLEKPVENSLRR